MRAAQKHIAFATDELGSEAYRGDALKKKQSLIERTAEDRAALDKYFIDPDGVVPFIENIEALGAHAGASVEIRTVGIEEAPEGALLERVSLQFRAEGTWESVFRLLTFVESLPISVTVKSVRFEILEGAEMGGQWRGVFDVSARKLR